MKKRCSEATCCSFSLTAFALLKKDLGSEYTVEEALFTMRNLKSKYYYSEIIIQELAKQQKEILRPSIS